MTQVEHNILVETEIQRLINNNDSRVLFISFLVRYPKKHRKGIFIPTYIFPNTAKSIIPRSRKLGISLKNSEF